MSSFSEQDSFHQVRSHLPGNFDSEAFGILVQQSFGPDLQAGYRIINERCFNLCLMVVEHYGLFRGRSEETIQTLVQKIGLAPQAYYVVQRMMQLLIEEGYLSLQGSTWIASRPFPLPAPTLIEASNEPALASDPIFEFFRRYEENLFRFLEGKRIGLAIIFRNGDTSFWRDLNNQSLFFTPYAKLAAFYVRACQPSGAHILEIGAGTGAATAQQLSLVQPERIGSYWYTDISKVFLQEGRRRFGHYPFMKYCVFDFNTTPHEQALAEESFDLIVGVNALHVARDLRRTLEFLVKLLKPSGKLVVGEGAPPARNLMWRLDLLFGLLEGWWRVSIDPALRPNPGWLMPSNWKTLFNQAGMTDICSLPGEEYFSGDCYGGIVVGQVPK